MPNFIKFGGTRVASNMVKCAPHILFKNIFYRRFLGKLYRKNTQQFQVLNGLKRSTVGNLGS